MCDCQAKMEAHLAAKNTTLAHAWSVESDATFLVLQTLKIDDKKRGKPQMALAGPYCTWCGQRLADNG